jgi:hypothetical protein
MSNKNIIGFLLLALLSLSGCAIGNKISYTGKTGIKPQYNNDTPILVICQDKRPYVISGDKKPNFVGLTRSLYGIPYPTATTSGKPLADDFAGLLINTFNGESGKDNAIAESVNPTTTDSEIVEIIKKSTPENGAALLYTITEWKTDTHFTASLHYNVKLSVYNKNGDLIKNKSIQGIDKLGNDQREERKTLANAINDIYGSLLNDEDMVSSIKVASTGSFPYETNMSDKSSNLPTEKSNKCSIEQILKMKEMGMSDSQVKSACE